LSNPDKKSVYDQFGEEGLKAGMGMNPEGGPGMDPNDIFGDLFGNMGMGGAGSRRAKIKKKAKNILHQIEVSLEDMYKGVNKVLEIQRYRMCSTCLGSGTKGKNVDTKCKGCNGKGIKVKTTQTPMGIMQQQVQCNECNGEGFVIKDKDKCTDCKGQKIITKKAKIELNIEPGAYDGKRIVFEKEGDELPGVEASDVYIELKQKPNSLFTRKGADLIYKMNITLLEALTGFKKSIPFIDGSKVVIINEPGDIIKPGILIFNHKE